MNTIICCHRTHSRSVTQMQTQDVKCEQGLRLSFTRTVNLTALSYQLKLGSMKFFGAVYT